MLSGKTALITGGIGDLGNEMALHLAQAGANIVLWDLKEATEAAARLSRVSEPGTQVRYQQIDVTERAEVESAIEQIVDSFGSLDIVCINAGITAPLPFLELTLENWNAHLAANLTGAFNTAQLAAQKMIELGARGRLVFTSSWVGTVPFPGHTAYNVTKAGVNMLMKQAAGELAPHGIRANAVAPGIVDAGMAGRELRDDPAFAEKASRIIPLKQLGSAAEIAQAVVYLASPQAEYMTGVVLTVDGGASLAMVGGEDRRSGNSWGEQTICAESVLSAPPPTLRPACVGQGRGGKAPFIRTASKLRDIPARFL